MNTNPRPAPAPTPCARAERNELIAWVSTLSDAELFRLFSDFDDQTYSGALDYLDPDLPIFIRTRAVRVALVNGVIAHIVNRFASTTA